MSSLNSFDYKILSGYMENYQKLVDEYKTQASQMTEQRYNRVKSIVKGITEVYNNATLQEQQLRCYGGISNLMTLSQMF